MSGGTGALNTGYLGGTAGPGAWLGTRDHKRIAVLFLSWSLGVFVLGLLYAIIMKLRAQSGIIDTHAYHQMLTQHGILMVFMFVVPAIPSILGHFVLPLQLGATNMAMPGFSLWSFRFYALGTLLFLVSLFAGPVATGWTFLTPFALTGEGAFTLLAIGLCLAALGWLLTGVNIIVTVHTRRDAGMGFFAMPLFSWGVYLTGYLLAAVGSLFSIVIVYLALSRDFAGGIFGPGSDPLLWQNYFWFVTTPAAFFALLPAVGVISDLIAGIARKGFTGYRLVVGSMIALLGLSFTTWGLRMLGTGLSDQLSVVFAFLNLAAVVPVALIVYCWLATLHRGAVMCGAPTTYLVAFLLQAGIGTVMGLFLSSLAVGRYLSNTLFVTAQSHYVMMGGVMTALLAGLHWWWPKLTGRLYRQGLGRFSAALYMIGLNLAFIPQLMQGVAGVPRGTYGLPAELATSEMVSAAGMWIMITGLVLMVSNLFGSLFDGQAAPANPWGAATLEWRAESPPPVGNFASTPVAGTDPYIT